MASFVRFLHIFKVALFAVVFAFSTVNVFAITCSDGEYLPAGASECAPCPSGQSCDGGTFDYNTDHDQGIREYPFSVTTVEMLADSEFSFNLSPAGTFYVDCGDGGTLSGAGVSDTTITRSNRGNDTYTCTYSTPGVKTIKFAGTPTMYQSTGSKIASISFENNQYIESLSGDLSQIFTGPASFIKAFKNCTNLKSIPSTLFSGYTTSEYLMFSGTFQDCTSLTSIPNGLFSNITNGAGTTSFPGTGSFVETFAGCTGLKSIPADLFSGVRTASHTMFWGTFRDCTGLTSIPDNLFANVTNVSAGYVFQETFKGCTGLKSLPKNLFAGITTASGYSFFYTFVNCTGLTGYVPTTMFAGLIANNHPYTDNMMKGIFQNTGLLTRCPDGMNQYITGYEDYWNSKVSCEYADYTITFVNNGNSYDSPITYKITDTITLPSIDDASFMGWCNSVQNCTTSAVIDANGTYTGWYGDKTLYARYRATSCDPGQYLTDNQCVSCPDNYPDSDGYSACYTTCPVQCKDHSDHCNYDSHVADFIDYYDGDNSRIPCNLESVTCVQHYDYNASNKICVPHNYTITYMSDETQLSGLTPTTYTIESEALSLPTPTRSGYEFDGWYTDYTFEGEPVTQIASGSTYDKTFYAKWTPIVYTIDYEFLAGASWPEDSLHPDSYTIESETITLATPVKTGYEFGGWYTNSSLEGNPVTQISTGSIGNKVFYAKWTPIVYTIEYILSSGGSWPAGALHPDSYTIESETINLATPIRVGYYEFDGWYTDSDFEGPSVTQITTGSTGNKVLYAKWTDYSSQIEISCDNGYVSNNNGSAVLDSSVGASAYAYKNHTGRSTETDASLPKVNAGAERGKWGANFAYGKVYGFASCNTMVGQTPSTSPKYSTSAASTMSRYPAAGAACWCKMTEFTLTDQIQVDTPDTPWVYVTYYTLLGEAHQYNCEVNCANQCAKSAAYNRFYRTQLFENYSSCKETLYNVIYHTNEGVMDENITWPEQYSVASGAITLPTNVTKEFFNFGGWCETQDLRNCSTTKQIPTGSYGDKHFYAKWVGEKHYIHFNPGAVDVEKNSPGTMSDQDAYYEDVYLEIKPNTFVRNGYAFDGWNCVVQGETEPIQLSEQTIDGVKHYTIDSYMYPTDTTCTAKWKVEDYTITYNGYASTSSYPETYTVESESISIPDATSDNEQIEFKGWCVNAEDNCSEAQLKKNYVIPSNSFGNVVLWAHWGAAIFDITYYYSEDNYTANPSVPLTSAELTTFNLPGTYTYGTETTLPALPDQERHAFIGWYNADDLSGSAVTTISDNEIGNKSFVAKWGPTQYRITYYSDIEKNDVFRRDVYTIEDANITELPQPTKSKFQFTGWKDFENDESVESINTADSKDIELYATWTRIGCDDGYYLPSGSQTCQKCPSDFPYSNGDNAKTAGYCYAICKASDLRYDYVYPYHCWGAKEGTCRYYAYLGGQNLFDSNMCNSAFYMSPSHYQNSSLGVCKQDWGAQMNMEGQMNNRPCQVKIDQCAENFHFAPGFGQRLCTGNTYNITYHVGNNTLTSEEMTNLGLPATYNYWQPKTLPALEDSAYDFFGWYDNIGFEGEPIETIQRGESGAKEFWARTETPGAYVIALKNMTGATWPANTEVPPIEYTRASETIVIGTPIKEGYIFDSWCDDEEMTQNCEQTKTIPTGSTGNKTFYAKWVFDNGHSITYKNGDDVLDLTPNTYTVGSTIVLPIASVSSGKIFAGWCLDGDNNCSLNNALNGTVTSVDWNAEDIVLKAQWVDSKFEVTTVNLTANSTLTFDISASGTFYVDCGNGGILSGSGVSGTKIERSNTNRNRYTCSYATAGQRVVSFGGAATGYNSSVITEIFPSGSPAQAAISFYNQSSYKNAKQISGISGSLGAIFGTVGNGDTLATQPRFIGTFYDCENLTGQIPESLFLGVYGQPVDHMFANTFLSCFNLTGSIPGRLFGELNGTASKGLFAGTFENCSRLTGTIPEELFAGLHGQISDGAFAGTFWNCSNITSVPENLFSSMTSTPSSYMFYATFAGTGIRSIPATLFAKISGRPAEAMFADTFYDCKEITAIPGNLFATISGQPANSMFEGTFQGCSKVTTIPENLFSTISGPTVPYLFWATFAGCTSITEIPSDLFSGVYGAPMPYLFDSTFNNCTGLSKIPAGLFKNIYGKAAEVAFNRTFYNCTNVTGFSDENGNTISAYIPENYMNNVTQNDDAYFVATEMFGKTGLLETCPSGTIKRDTIFDTDWEPKVSCIQTDKVYTITLNNMDDATWPATATIPPTEYTSESKTIVIGTPTKEGYTFKGWCENAKLTQNCTTTKVIASGSEGNKIFYAKWEEIAQPDESCPADYHIQSNPLVNFDYASDGNGYAYTSISGTSSKPSPATLPDGDWETYFDTGSLNAVHGHAWCSTTSGSQQYDIADDINTAVSGANCWCQATGITLNDNKQKIAAGYVYITEQTNATTCQNSCALNCAKHFAGQSQFRKAVYDSLTECAPDVYTIIYNVDGHITSEEYVSTDTVILPNPTKDYYNFAGWCIGSTNCDSPINGKQYGWFGDKILYAQWTPKSYTITYVLNDGQFLVPSTIPYSYVVNQTTTLPIPIHENSSFDGWYDNEDLKGVSITTLPTSKLGDITLYAKWRPGTYQITYIVNGEEIVLPDVATVADGIAVTLPQPSNIPQGQSFAGWCDSYDTATDTYKDCSYDKVLSAYDPITLYGKFEPSTLKIKYYDGDTEIIDSDLQSEFTYGDTVQLKTVQKDHYDFINWHSDSNLSDSSVIEEIPSTASSDQVLYAEYDATPYSVTFNVNTDEVPEPINYTIETLESQPITLPNVPTVANRSSSIGWYKNSNLRGAALSKLTVSEAGVTELYADVSYSSCGAGYQTQNSDIAVLDSSSNTSTSAYRTISGGNPTVQSEKLPDIVKNNTSNGKWGAYYPNFNAAIYGEASCNNYNGGKPSEKMLYSESQQTMSRADVGTNCWCHMTDYTLNEANKVDTSTKASWIYSDTFDTYDTCAIKCPLSCVTGMRTNQFFRSQVFGPYSICKPRVYNIEYETNGGTRMAGINFPSQYTIVYKDVVIPTAVTKPNYTFDKWCEDEELSVCAKPKKISTGSSGDVKLYAKWTPDVHYIQFNHGTINGSSNEFTGSMANQTVHYGDIEVELTPNAFAIDGYEFEKWSCTATNNSDETYTGEYSDSGHIKVYEYKSDMICTAQWKPVEYNIIYKNVSDATWPDGKPTTFTINSENITIPNPSRLEYELSGWCVGAEDNCTRVQLQKPYTIVNGTVGDVTLWAHWTAATYNITYKNQDDDSEIEGLVPDTYTFGTETLLPETVDNTDRPHYYFDGWYDGMDENSQIVTKISSGTSKDQTFWAKWTPTSYTITYYWDSDKLDVYDTASYTVEDNNITPLPTPTKEHFQFSGWMDEENNTIDTIVVADGGNRELYATWTRTSCEDNNYLKNGKCFTCPVEYPLSDGMTATNKTDCYAVCPSTTPCPEHSVSCDYSGKTFVDNKQYYIGAEPVSCNIEFDCDTYYTPFNNVLINEDQNKSGTVVSAAIISERADSGTWKTSFAYGAVSGEAICSATAGTNYTPGIPDTATDGAYCWCRETKFTPIDYARAQTQSGLGVIDLVEHDYSRWYENQPLSSWVLAGNLTDTASCKHDCAATCANELVGESSQLRETMFNAICLPDIYKINYWDGMQQITDIEPKSYTYGVMTELNNASKPNYDFNSWHTNSNLSAESVITNISSTTHGDIDLYSKWTPKQYEIIFEHGTAGSRTEGFTGSMDNVPVKYDDTNIVLPQNAFAITGYEFLEWVCVANYRDEEHTNSYRDGATIDAYKYSSNMVCTAQWQAKKNELFYDCNGGNLAAGKSSPVRVSYDADYDLDSSICENQDYTIESWTCTNGLDTTNPKWNITEDSLCVAEWTPIEYPITYKDADGNVITGLKPTVYTAFEELVVPEQEPVVPEHFKFAGWCDEDGENCDLQRIIPMGSSAPGKVFVAKMIRISCPEGYDLVGEEDNISCTPQKYEISYIIDGQQDYTLSPLGYIFGDSVSLPTITKDGYTFIGWCDGVKKCKTKLNGTQDGFIGNKVLYANWAENSINPTCTTGYKLRPAVFANIVDTETNGTNYYALGDKCFTLNDIYEGENCPGTDEEFNALDMNSWKAVFGYGAIYGTSLCSTATQSSDEFPSADSGDNCWCNMTGYKAKDSGLQSASEVVWAFASNSAECESNCPQLCAQKVINNSIFRTSLFEGTVINACIENTRYNIRYYNVNDGDWPDGAEHRLQYTEEDESFTIGTPERDGYVFGGWCESYDSETNTYSNCSETKVVSQGSIGDKSFYAKWGCNDGYILSGNRCVLDIYEITYHNTQDSTTVNNRPNPTSYNVESGTIEIQNLERSNGDIFLGWCDGENNCSEPVKDFYFEPSRAEDIDLYAVWNVAEEFNCTNGKWLNFGGSRTCLSTKKITSPSMVLNKGNKKYYLQMTKQPFNSEGLKMNKDAKYKLNVLYNGDVYNVHDASVGNN